MPTATAHATRPAPSPARYWRHWHEVLATAPDGTVVLVDSVVLGPTGIHVVLHQRPGAPGAPSGTTPADALAAAAAVRTALPDRYHPVVTAALQVAAAGDGVGAGAVVEGVVVAPAPVLTEAIRFRPRVLSSSEVALLATALDRGLTPQVVPATRSSRWSRWTRRARAPRATAA